MMLERRGEEVLSVEIDQSAGGTLTVGPFAHDTIVRRMGAIVTTALDAGDVSVTTSPDKGSMTLAQANGALGNRFVKDLVDNPSAADGTQPGTFTLAAGSTIDIVGAAVGGSTGDYILFAEVQKLPVFVDDVNVFEG